MTVKAYNIDYDTDGDVKLYRSLPKELIFSQFESIEDIEDNLADAISDKTGFCIFSYRYEIIKTDFLGNELHCGDEVAFFQIGYRGFMKGTIQSMSTQKAKIVHEKTNTGKTESIQFYNQIIKIQK